MKSHTFHTTTWLEVFWKDDYLAWNSSEFSDIQYLRLPADKVWVPSICNVQEISGKRCVTYESVADTSSEVLVDSSGQVVRREDIQSIIMCAFNTQKLPFDNQTWEFEFFPTNYCIHGTNIMYPFSVSVKNYFKICFRRGCNFVKEGYPYIPWILMFRRYQILIRYDAVGLTVE